MNKKNIIFFITGILLVIFLFYFFEQREEVEPEISNACGSYSTTNIQISGITLKAQIADTDCKTQLGLSGRKSLEKDNALLFTFPRMGNYGFWMKDMNFSLDIIWVGESFTITGIQKNISQNTYPEIFGENFKARYVIEVKSGFSDAYGIKVGDKIKIL